MATSSLQHLARQGIRTAKNYTKGYSDTQTKVREATSNDPWGPSGTQMNEIAQMTYNQQDFVEIMEVLDKRLNDKGKNWRHVFKSLTLVDYMIHAGSENVVLYFKENAYIIKTLKEFVFMDEEGKDQGANVRQKAKDISALLADENRLREARKGRASMRDRLSGANPTNTSDDPYFRPGGGRNRSRSNPQPSRRPGGSSREDDDLRRAIEESKRTAEAEGHRESPAPQPSRNRANDDADLERALRLSKEEDDQRRRELERNQNGLFDEQQRQQERANQLIDFDGGQQQMMPQFTGMPMQQFNSYNPYAAQQQAQQEEYMRMQAQLAQLEAQRQAEAQSQQQQADYQAMMQQQAFMQAQAQQHAQYLTMQHTMQTQPLMPQPTAFGTNNPFAAFSNTSSPTMPSQSPMLQQQESPRPQQQNSLAPPELSSPQRPASTPARAPRDDGQHAHLASLIGGGGSGIDTYGNVGNMRIPAGSAFHASNRLNAQATGTNPFTKTAVGSNQLSQQQRQEQPFFEL